QPPAPSTVCPPPNMFARPLANPDGGQHLQEFRGAACGLGTATVRRQRKARSSSCAGLTRTNDFLKSVPRVHWRDRRDAREQAADRRAHARAQGAGLPAALDDFPTSFSPWSPRTTSCVTTCVTTAGSRQA